MVTFARTLLVLGILAAALAVILATVLRDLPWVGRAAVRIGALLGFVFFGLAAWAILSRESPLFGRMTDRGPAGCHAIALTFDDGPAAGATPRVLDILRKTRTPATFFVIGSRAARAPDLLRRIRDEGHTLGNHGFSHHAFVFVLPGWIAREISRTDDVVRDATGLRPAFVRLPYGIRGPFAAGIVRRSGRPVVGWSVYPADARRPGAGEIVERVIHRVGPGDIVLLHDGGGDRSATVAALPLILSGLRARHLPVIPLADLLAGRCS